MEAGKNRMVLGFAIIFIIVIVVLGYALGGVRGIAGIFNFVKWAVIGGLIIGMVVWGVWYLFIRKVRDDRVALNQQTIVKQAMLTKPETLRDLYLSGDKDHPQIKLGKIIGFTRIKNIKGDEENVFVYKKSGFPVSAFEDAKAIRVKPERHSEMIGDIIIQGISLVAHGGFYYINTDHLDITGIDKTIKAEVMRKYTMDTLSDVKLISDMAIGINPEHQKYIEGKSLLKVPSRQEPIQPQQPYEEQRRY